MDVVGIRTATLLGNSILMPLVAHIECPVLLAWAKDDFVIPLKRSAPAFHVFKSYRLEVFNGGHAAFLEDPDRFESVLRAFLRPNPGWR